MEIIDDEALYDISEEEVRELYEFYDKVASVDGPSSELVDSSMAYLILTDMEKYRVLYTHPSGVSTILETYKGFAVQKSYGGDLFTQVGPNEDFLIINNEGLEILNDEQMSLKYPKAYYYMGHEREMSKVSNDDSYMSLNDSSVSFIINTFAEMQNVKLGTPTIDRPSRKRKYTDLYEKQDMLLQDLEATSGFHMLAGDENLGKIRIASTYINNLVAKNPDARILIVEPKPEAMEEFKALIKHPVRHLTMRIEYLKDAPDTIYLCNGKQLANPLQNADWDLIVFDDFHEMYHNRPVLVFPYKLNHLPDNILAMTDSLSNLDSDSIWKVSNRFIAMYTGDNKMSFVDMAIRAPISDNLNPDIPGKRIPIMSHLSCNPRFAVKQVLSDYTVNTSSEEVTALHNDLQCEAFAIANEFSMEKYFEDNNRKWYDFLNR